MARIRTIKPSFFKNEELADLPMPVRLLFVGLWTLADKEGRLEDRPKRIKVELFPYDTLDIDASLSKLQSAGFITRYEVGEMKLIEIDTFSKHQRITGSEAESISEYPAPSDGKILDKQGNTSETPKTTGREGKGMDIRKGKDKPHAASVSLFPSHFSEKFKEEWDKWKEYKLKEHRFGFKSDHSEKASISKLLKLAKNNELAAKILIENSIASGWKGFFQSDEVEETVKVVHKIEHEVKKPDKNITDINFLYERFLENECSIISIDSGHYTFLKNAGKMKFDSIAAQAIKNEAVEKLSTDNLAINEESIRRFSQKFAVIHLFKQLQKTGTEAVFA